MESWHTEVRFKLYVNNVSAVDEQGKHGSNWWLCADYRVIKDSRV